MFTTACVCTNVALVVNICSCLVRPRSAANDTPHSQLSKPQELLDTSIILKAIDNNAFEMVELSILLQ